MTKVKLLIENDRSKAILYIDGASKGIYVKDEIAVAESLIKKLSLYTEGNFEVAIRKDNVVDIDVKEGEEYTDITDEIVDQIGK